MNRRLTDAACEVLVAWPLVTAVWLLDKVAGRVIDARGCRWPNVTGGDDD